MNQATVGRERERLWKPESLDIDDRLLGNTRLPKLVQRVGKRKMAP